ncbi:hypothetical protein O6P37_10335 [Mycobacterium sp. CPCC 205372]|uniref:Lipoprotein n=1 Tax=Mycobacterium hippophais TaxID=3016340 RepID=A0ABT4PRU2_9MYCO|nr:hypothetical protein [Mycobacterium hippophais]MCZ8379261.1 hypothetical protein [Mycobacterium hippophais]
MANVEAGEMPLIKPETVVAVGMVGLLLAAIVAGCSNPPEPPSAPMRAEDRSALYADFSTRSDGDAPERFSSGQQVNIAPKPTGAPRLTLVAGRLAVDPPSSGRDSGVVRSPDLGQPITRIGMEWNYTPGAGDGSGLAILGITNLPLDQPEGAPIPVQFMVGQNSWSLSVSPGAIGGDLRLIPVADGAFSAPLPADGSAQRVEIDLDGPVATVHLPDGTARKVSDPRIAAWAGRVAFFGVYAETGVADSRAGLLRVWADT